MEENIEYTILFDIYGELLTDHQKEIFSEYYLYNLSLREIAQNHHISYQAVRDSIKSSENLLKKFDSKLEMASLLDKLRKIYEMCQSEKDLNKVRDEIIELLKSEVDIDV